MNWLHTKTAVVIYSRVYVTLEVDKQWASNIGRRDHSRLELMVPVYHQPMQPSRRKQTYTDKEGTTAIVEKYRKLVKKTKQARLGQIILSGILLVCGNRIHGYRNSKRMAVNGMVERLCKEEDVGYVDMWDSFVGNEELYFRDGLHLSGKGVAVLAEGLSGAVASGLGKVRYLSWAGGGEVEKDYRWTWTKG